jgi:hypothetical protein
VGKTQIYDILKNKIKIKNEWVKQDMRNASPILQLTACCYCPTLLHTKINKSTNKTKERKKTNKGTNKQTLLEMAADFFTSTVFQFEDEQKKCF